MARIIVIDDSQYLAKQIKDFLESEGHQVLAVGHDGNEGVNLYKMYHPDLITLDVTMPNKDGKQCLEEILEHDPEAKVLMISSLKDHGLIMSCLDVGAVGYQEKPLKFQNENFCQEFRETIIEALN